MDFNRLVARARNILLTPKTEWPVIAGEPTSVSQLFTGYVLILAAIPAVAGFIKVSVIGMAVPFMGTIRLGMGAGIGQMLLQYGLALGMTFVLALIIDALAPTFGGEKNLVKSLQLIAYSYTAAWIAGIFHIVPVIGSLLAIAAAIYSLYTFYLGVPAMKKCPQDKAVVYTIVVVVCGIVVGAVLFNVLFAVIAGGSTMGMMGTGR